jgi:hypothetical protein
MTVFLLGLNWQAIAGTSNISIALLSGAFCSSSDFWRLYNRWRFNWLLYFYSLSGFIPPIYSQVMKFYILIHIRYHSWSYVGPGSAYISHEIVRSLQNSFIMQRNDHLAFLIITQDSVEN